MAPASSPAGRALRGLFEGALRVSLAGPLVAGCQAGVDTSGFDRVRCEGGYPSLVGINPAQAIDYLELRLNSSVLPSERHESTLATSGVRCATATDKAACDKAVMDFVGTAGFGHRCVQLCVDYYLLSLKGDVITSIETQQALAAFFGTIDTPEEAALMVLAGAYELSCTNKQRGAVRQTATGWEVVATTGIACGKDTSVVQHLLAVSADGAVSERSSSVIETGDSNCAIGRRPVGLRRPRAGRGCDRTPPLGAHFATCAHLEAASVPAFVRLRDELASHGAPGSLRVRAMLAAADEVRHTRSTTLLARRFGATPARPHVAARPLRDLAEVARDNAVEGCVRETFGALVAHRQSLRAADAGIAAALRTIAADETRHAELSWDAQAWALTRLSRRERGDLHAARRAAVERLRVEVSAPVAPVLIEAAGLPPGEEAVALVDALDASLWSQG